MALLCIFLWIVFGRGGKDYSPPRGGVLRIGAACVLPGMVVSLFLSASLVSTWPKGQLWYGATSLREMVGSILEASLYELNPQVANPLIYSMFRWCAPLLFPALGIMAVGQLAFVCFRPNSGQNSSTQWRATVSVFLGVVLILAVAAHWCLFRVAHVPLPKERTGLLLFLYASFSSEPSRRFQHTRVQAGYGDMDCLAN